jgi:hypothetical protein
MGKNCAIASTPVIQFPSTGLTLRSAARTFYRFPTPVLLTQAFCMALIARLVAGNWGRSDLLMAGIILALEPFTEWVIHVFVLHFRPKVIAGRKIDLLVAKKHRAHHADPKDLGLVFIPLHVLGIALPAGVAGFLLANRHHLSLGLTGIATSFGMLLLYEWTHYLIHSTYRPRGRYYRSIWRSHRLHHFRNEHYWFGVTITLGDRVLRTYPNRRRVPESVQRGSGG